MASSNLDDTDMGLDEPQIPTPSSGNKMNVNHNFYFFVNKTFKF